MNFIKNGIFSKVYANELFFWQRNGYKIYPQGIYYPPEHSLYDFFLFIAQIEWFEGISKKRGLGPRASKVLLVLIKNTDLASLPVTFLSFVSRTKVTVTFELNF